MVRGMGTPWVVVRQPGRTALHLVVCEAVVVGRDCEGLLLTDPEISRRHVQLEPAGSELTLTDLGSTNGTTVDGRRVCGSVRLVPGQVARLGGTTIERVDIDSGRHSAVVTDIALDRELRATSIDLVAAAVVEERPTLEADDAGTLTIVFCDIEDSTRRAVEFGDTRWMEVLEVHNAIVRRQTIRHRGTEIKAQGDGFMLSFPSARSALEAMIAVQRALAAWAGSRPADAVRVRVGVHTGEVIRREDGDLFGRHVILAARIAGAAYGGEILVSSLVRELVEPRGVLHFGEPRTIALKGLDGPHVVHRVEWAS